jgi:hypothetical protein
MATEAWAIQRTFARLIEKGVPPEAIKAPNIISLIPDALRRMTFRLAQAPPEDPRRQMLESATTVALTAGIGDLATLESGDYLPDTIDRGKITHSSSTYPLQDVGDELALNWPWDKFTIKFCISGNKIKTRDVTGDDPLTNLTGNLNVVAVAIPALSALKTQLETDFIDEMEALALPAMTKKK